jgi:uncharacterized protein
VLRETAWLDCSFARSARVGVRTQDAETVLGPCQLRFAADRMLGRLAKMLRLLGYDTLYSPNVTRAELREIAGRRERVVLTRGTIEKCFPRVADAFRVESERAQEQLREVVERFRLDTRAGLWTRCTLCNGIIERVDKASIQGIVAPKVFQIYDEFFRCSGCGHVYWCGSHVERILRNLEKLLGTGGEGRS